MRGNPPGPGIAGISKPGADLHGLGPRRSGGVGIQPWKALSTYQSTFSVGSPPSAASLARPIEPSAGTNMLLSRYHTGRQLAEYCLSRCTMAQPSHLQYWHLIHRPRCVSFLLPAQAQSCTVLHRLQQCCRCCPGMSSARLLMYVKVFIHLVQ